MEKYLFIVSVAVEHSSVLVIDHLVHKLVGVCHHTHLARLGLHLREVSLAIQSRFKFPEKT